MKALPTLLLAVVLLALSCLGSGCRHSPPPTPSRTSVVLITIDTLRPDRLGCYGHRINQTPAIDRLAREGVLFEQAYSDIPWTTGSMASVMTGAYSSGHGVQLPVHKLLGSALTLAEILSADGYQTGAIIGSFPLDSVYGLAQGFETYDDSFSLPILMIPGQAVKKVGSYLDDDVEKQRNFVFKKLTNDAYRPDNEVTEAAIKWLDKEFDGRPFFLWVHYFGPHEKLNWDLGVPKQEPAIIAAYDKDVEIADRAVGALLDELRSRELLDSSLVILHSDHGQSLGEHNYVGHGMHLYDESTRIPLIVRYPALFPPGIRSKKVVRNVDILPTVLDALEIMETDSWAGRSLVPANGQEKGGRDQPDQDFAYLETHASSMIPVVTPVSGLGKVLGPVSRTAVRTGKWKLITSRVVGPCSHGLKPARTKTGRYYLEDPTPIEESRCKQIEVTELYQAAAPEEPGLDLAAKEPEVVKQLREVLSTASSGGQRMRGEFVLSPEQKRKLKSLGYLQ